MVHNKILVLIFNFFNVFVVLGLIVFSLLALCLSFGHVSFFWILQLTKYGHFKANDNAQCLSDVSCTCHSPANLNKLTHVSHFDLVGYIVHRKHCTFTIFDAFKLQIAIPCIWQNPLVKKLLISIYPLQFLYFNFLFVSELCHPFTTITAKRAKKTVHWVSQLANVFLDASN